MLTTTGRKEKLSASQGSEIEASSSEYENGTGNVWYRAVLEENLAKSKRKKLSVRHLHPQLKEDYLPPVITTSFHRLIRPVPPQDPFPDVDFEEGDMVDAARDGGWWSGWVLKALGNRRFSVYLRFEPDVLEFDRKSLRPHLVWKDEEWFRCEKRVLTESDFSAGKRVEVKTKVETFGDVWAPGMAIKENEDGTVLVKYKVKSLSGECAKISVPFSRIQPLPPPCGERVYGLMDSVHVLVESGWCPGVITKLLYGKKYTVKFGQSKMSVDFDHSKLRPSVKWRDGVWKTKEKVMGSDESPHVVEETTASNRIRVTIRTPLRATRSSSSSAIQNPTLASCNGGGVAEASEVSVVESETLISETASQLSGVLGSEMAHAVMNGNTNTPVPNQPEIAATKESHSSVVLGVAAIQGKTTPRKKLQTMKNQKSSSNDSVGEKAPEETSNRESVNKRKRGQPRKFISTEPIQKTGVAGSDSNPTTTETANMDEDDNDTPLASWVNGGNSSSGQQSASQSPDPMLNSVVEKHVDVVNTPLAKESTMVLPFAKRSPCWKVLEAMEILKAVPQRPHFLPLLEKEEESREGDAIGAMVTFTGLLEKVNNLQVDDPASAINRIIECFDKLEKHGFDVTAPRSRIGKLLSIKESQGLALQELQVAEREIAENDNKRRKCEADIEDVSRKVVELQKKVLELQEQQALLKEEKVTMDMDIDRMQSRAAVLDQKVQSEEHMFRTTVAAPWN